MIRVNLLRDATGGGAVGHAASGIALEQTSTTLREEKGAEVDIIIKLALVLLPVALTVAYRNYQIGERKSLQVQLQTQTDELNQKLRTYEPGLKDIEKFQEEKRKLDNQLMVIKQLSKERLKNVKSMDALQGLIPARAWLTALKINENKVELEGRATDDLVISDFMKDLEASIYFANVTLNSSEELKTGEGAVKAFRIECVLQNL